MAFRVPTHGTGYTVAPRLPSSPARSVRRSRDGREGLLRRVACYQTPSYHTVSTPRCRVRAYFLCATPSWFSPIPSNQDVDCRPLALLLASLFVRNIHYTQR